MIPETDTADSVTLRVLVVDDSLLYRKMIQDVLDIFPGVEVVGSAQDGQIALIKARSLKPDVITLDIQMPEMDGLEVLEHLKAEQPETTAIVCSMFTTEGARITLRALELGAFDFIPKPASGTLEDNRTFFKSAIAPMLDALMRLKAERQAVAVPLLEVSGMRKTITEGFPGFKRLHEKSMAVAIGISTGGPVALAKMMPDIPADIGVPLFIVQHMPPMFTGTLAAKLNSICQITVKEAVDGEIVCPNTAYIAPGGKQMKISPTPDTGYPMLIRITDDAAENNCKPSADYLFRSVAGCYGRHATGVIMTGMGYDGSEGLKLMKERGAFIIAQDESTSLIYGMPRKPVEMGIVDVIAPLETIAGEICRTVSD